MNTLKRIIYSCKRATLLIDKKELENLTIREMIELRIHLYGCGFCRLYKKQSRLINNMVQQLFSSSVQSIKLDDNFKTDLRERIEEELNKN